MPYYIPEVARAEMHRQLDNIINKINDLQLHPLFALPDVSIGLTFVDYKEAEHVLEVGVELAEYNDPKTAPSVETRWIHYRKFEWTAIDRNEQTFEALTEWRINEG